MTYRGAVDPAPDHDLPSDIAFRLFLTGLNPETITHEALLVERDSVMERWVAEVRRNQ